MSVEAHYQPASSIKKDYGLVVPSEDRLDVVVCDVSGHGISSALVANRIYSEAMAQIESGAGLGSMLRHLNHFAVQNLASSTFYFTVAAMRLHRARGYVQFAGAGHPPAIIVRQGQSPQLLESTHMILGLFENVVGGDASVETAVETGDRIVLYTDGLTENFNSHREVLGLDGCQEIVEEASTLPVAEMKSRILERVAAWRHGHAVDDVPSCCLKSRNFPRVRVPSSPSTTLYHTGLSVRIVTLFLSRHLSAETIRGFDADMGDIAKKSGVAAELQKSVVKTCECDPIIGHHEFKVRFSVTQLDTS